MQFPQKTGIAFFYATMSTRSIEYHKKRGNGYQNQVTGDREKSGRLSAPHDARASQAGQRTDLESLLQL